MSVLKPSDCAAPGGDGVYQRLDAAGGPFVDRGLDLISDLVGVGKVRRSLGEGLAESLP